ncbi:MAG: sigma-70 family RNA polymerase sigma factor [Pseudomonadota bacterium]
MSAHTATSRYSVRMDAHADDTQNRSDEELFLAYTVGDAAAFESVYRRHKDRLYRFVYRQLNGSAAVDEIFQDVWTRVIRARADFRKDGVFITWLYSIARNRLIDHFRADGRRRDVFVEDEEDESQHADFGERGPQALAINAELAQRLKELIGDLPPPQQEVFLLKEEAGLSVQQIATVTGCDPETAKSRLRYAINKLRKHLLEDHG